MVFSVFCAADVYGSKWCISVEFPCAFGSGDGGNSFNLTYDDFLDVIESAYAYECKRWCPPGLPLHDFAVDYVSLLGWEGTRAYSAERVSPARLATLPDGCHVHAHQRGVTDTSNPIPPPRNTVAWRLVDLFGFAGQERVPSLFFAFDTRSTGIATKETTLEAFPAPAEAAGRVEAFFRSADPKGLGYVTFAAWLEYAAAEPAAAERLALELDRQKKHGGSGGGGGGVSAAQQQPTPTQPTAQPVQQQQQQQPSSSSQPKAARADQRRRLRAERLSTPTAASAAKSRRSAAGGTFPRSGGGGGGGPRAPKAAAAAAAAVTGVAPPPRGGGRLPAAAAAAAQQEQEQEVLPPPPPPLPAVQRVEASSISPAPQPEATAPSPTPQKARAKWAAAAAAAGAATVDVSSPPRLTRQVEAVAYRKERVLNRVSYP